MGTLSMFFSPDQAIDHFTRFTSGNWSASVQRVALQQIDTIRPMSLIAYSHYDTQLPHLLAQENLTDAEFAHLIAFPINYNIPPERLNATTSVLHALLRRYEWNTLMFDRVPGVGRFRQVTDLLRDWLSKEEVIVTIIEIRHFLNLCKDVCEAECIEMFDHMEIIDMTLPVVEDVEVVDLDLPVIQ